ncbi:hypothetical protein VFPFJ_04972 [Purpureocillium lilacinum]|uniref:Uncharacterized protein n=1 Tax=Purpureocillium lilacinum TaxID=33203 RepID=A0A179HN85_PURLI|nr:hypothetical protein VFPFJ_04972 [Purpureocillium lilacinum]OAQ90813.1 hypothetical protein VFPFJ_04972 [Purpureocillium lilacinum]
MQRTVGSTRCRVACRLRNSRDVKAGPVSLAAGSNEEWWGGRQDGRGRSSSGPKHSPTLLGSSRLGLPCKAKDARKAGPAGKGKGTKVGEGATAFEGPCNGTGAGKDGDGRCWG